MKLINLQGLNCYHNSIISIVRQLGVDFPLAFADLWSESDFRYDSIREMYLSKRLVSNLERLGAKLEIQYFSAAQAVREALSQLTPEEYFVVGMDAYDIPWNPHYQTTYGAHYFIARCPARYTSGCITPSDAFHCFDPTYNKNAEEISGEALAHHAFEINRVRAVEPSVSTADPIRDAQAVIRTHPEQCKKIMAEINACKHKEQQEIVLLARYIDTMISNRYLLRCYLEQTQPPQVRQCMYLRSDFLIRWFAVKNGLYKASVCRGDEALLEEIRSSFQVLMEEELVMAGEMVKFLQ